ncbi:MAG: DNA polymerase III subunit beta [Brevinematales bacterium]|nr:DNA polymerase III subunit beta [Brevinematales bacterium]
MKFEISSKVFEKIVRPVVKATSSNKTLQILNHIYFDVSRDDINIIGANQQYTVRVKEKADVHSEGKFLVLGEKFLQILKTLPDTTITIKDEGNLISIETDSINFSLQTIPIEEYPKQILEVIETSYKFDLSQADMKKVTKKIVKFCSSDNTLQAIFTGVLFDLRESGDITFVATDTKRMGIFKSSYKSETDTTNTKFVVPAETLEILEDMLGDEGPINVGVNYDEDNQVRNVVFSLPTVTISSSVISGNFPNYEAVIPTGLSNYAIINKKSLEEAIKRVSTIVDKETNRVSFNFDAERLKIEVENSIIGYAKEVIPCKYFGNPDYLHFNYTFILDYLSSLEANEVYWGFTNYESANKLWSEDEKEFIYVVMPLRRS